MQEKPKESECPQDRGVVPAAGSATTTWPMTATESVAGADKIFFWNLDANSSWPSASGLIEPTSAEGLSLLSALVPGSAIRQQPQSQPQQRRQSISPQHQQFLAA